MNSIHGRVWRAAGLVTGAALLLAGSASYFLIQDDLIDDLDQSLVNQAHQLAEQVVRSADRGDEFRGSTTVETGRGFLLTSRQGKAFAHGGDPDLVDVAHPLPDSSPQSTITIDDDEVRIVHLVLPVKNEVGEESSQMISVTVSQDLDRIDHILAGIAVALFAVCVGVSSLVALFLGLATRRALQPIASLTSMIARIDPNFLPEAISPDATLPKELNVADPPIELQPIITQLNALLARLSNMVAHERAFSAAAAHELRTPLAGLRATLDVALARERDAASLSDSARVCQGIVRQMDIMVAGLLLLARTDARRTPTASVIVDLARVVDDAWADLSRTAEAHGKTIDFSVPAQAQALVEPSLTTIMIRTLLDNAIAHGSAEGPIRVAMAIRPASAENRAMWVLTVANPGCQITDEDLPKVFDRFWRGDPSRSADNRHSGLGLAICQSAAHALGCSVRVGVADGWFTATVEIPSITANDPTPMST